MMQVTMELDPQLERRLTAIEQTQQKILGLIQQGLAPQTAVDEWLKASQFCMTYSIGRTTLDRKVELGEIEVHDGHGKIKRYRWRKES